MWKFVRFDEGWLKNSLKKQFNDELKDCTLKVVAASDEFVFFFFLRRIWASCFRCCIIFSLSSLAIETLRGTVPSSASPVPHLDNNSSWKTSSESGRWKLVKNYKNTVGSRSREILSVNETIPLDFVFCPEFIRIDFKIPDDETPLPTTENLGVSTDKWISLVEDISINPHDVQQQWQP